MLSREKAIAALNTLPLRLYDPDTQSKIGGWMGLAGIDTDNVFRGRTLQSPLVGQQITIDAGRGPWPCTVTHCCTHSLGRLMYDITFTVPRPHFFVNPSFDRSPYDVIDFTELESEQHKRLYATELLWLLSNDSRKGSP